MAFPDGTADFRSDTVSRPTAEMRRAMADAEVGDDVYGEDPTVAALQEEAAAAVGTEAALFVPSGTMGNQIAVHLLTRPGDEIVCNEWAHVRNYEHGAASWLSGVAFRSVPGDGGVVTVEQIRAAVDQSGYHLPAVSLLVWENSHNVSGGAVVPLETMVAGTAAARTAGLRVHLDGARLFNAAAATGTPAFEFADQADTVMFCLSKGLGAPVGGVVAQHEDVYGQILPGDKLPDEGSVVARHGQVPDVALFPEANCRLQHTVPRLPHHPSQDEDVGVVHAQGAQTLLVEVPHDKA